MSKSSRSRQNQLGAIRRWRARHPEKIRFYHYHGEARTFIRKMSRVKDLKELLNLIQTRWYRLTNQNLIIKLKHQNKLNK